MGLFGKTNERPPKDLVQEWTHKIRKEGYNIDRQIKGIQREEEKTKRMLKDAAKKGEKDSCKVLAKEIVNARKAVSRLHAAKAHMNSVQLSMKQQLANLRIAGALEKSTQVMTSMQNLLKVPEIMATMRDMSKEMMKAGIIEEMMDDAMDVMDDEDLEEAADGEVEKVLYELTAGELGKAPEAVEDSLPAEPMGATAGPSYLPDEEEEEEDMSAMQARLEALRS
ncbi:charged multivesicular body protein 3-like [Babylonia areolata]|uniref:charged multivesicular body protein 3-like n=1 Tax=Babylonia areolata TaxID=304850 RepID=UPI003FD5851C